LLHAFVDLFFTPNTAFFPQRLIVVCQEGFVATVGHVEDVPPGKNKYLRSEGESIKKFPDK
jgi:hypothetical protein